MAIRVAGTEVINDALELVNITGAFGTYDDFQPTVTPITTTLDMTLPVMTRTMAAGQEFTSLNRGTGRTSVLLLDTSVSNYVPVFNTTSAFYFAGGTLPVWSSSRYWVITFICYSTSFIMVNAAGYDF
jgi:hypothetical protein